VSLLILPYGAAAERPSDTSVVALCTFGEWLRWQLNCASLGSLTLGPIGPPLLGRKLFSHWSGRKSSTKNHATIYLKHWEIENGFTNSHDPPRATFQLSAGQLGIFYLLLDHVRRKLTA
jgi:hypothetical protein